MAASTFAALPTTGVLVATTGSAGGHLRQNDDQDPHGRFGERGPRADGYTVTTSGSSVYVLVNNQADPSQTVLPVTSIGGTNFKWNTLVNAAAAIPANNRYSVAHGSTYAGDLLKLQRANSR